MTYQIGDPNHLGVHNDLTAAVRSAASRAGVTVVLPDEAHLGDTGHVSDHNLIATALAEIAAKGGGMTWAKVTGGTVTEVTNSDGSVDEVHTFTADGSLVVEEPGYARVFMISGGSGAINSATSLQGAGGRVLNGIFQLPSGNQGVVVGIGGAVDQLGWPSSLGELTTYASPGAYGGAGTLAPPTAGYGGFPSDISGSTLTYGQEGRAGATRVNRGDGAQAGGSGSAGVVIVRTRKTPPTSVGVACTGGTETTYTGDGVNGILGTHYKVHTFTGNGDLVVAQGGEVDVLIISGGGCGASGAGVPGLGGPWFEGKAAVMPGTFPVVIGAGATSGLTASGGSSAVGKATAPAGSASGGPATGLTSTISGATVEYAKPGQAAPRANTGDGGATAGGVAGAAGLVIVRYPIA